MPDSTRRLKISVRFSSKGCNCFKEPRQSVRIAPVTGVFAFSLSAFHAEEIHHQAPPIRSRVTKKAQPCASSLVLFAINSLFCSLCPLCKICCKCSCLCVYEQNFGLYAKDLFSYTSSSSIMKYPYLSFNFTARNCWSCLVAQRQEFGLVSRGVGRICPARIIRFLFPGSGRCTVQRRHESQRRSMPCAAEG